MKDKIKVLAAAEKAAITREQTARLTRDICDYLILEGHKAWRQNVLPVPLSGGGFRSGSKAGQPDVVGILCDPGGRGGCYFGIEVKTGRDKLRDVQKAFHFEARKLGAIILVVKTFEDFFVQWMTLKKNKWQQNQ